MAHGFGKDFQKWWEESMIARALLNPNLMKEINYRCLGEGDFIDQENLLIFQAMRSLCEEGSPIDPISIIEKVQFGGGSRFSDGIIDKICSLADNFPDLPGEARSEMENNEREQVFINIMAQPAGEFEEGLALYLATAAIAYQQGRPFEALKNDLLKSGTHISPTWVKIAQIVRVLIFEHLGREIS